MIFQPTSRTLSVGLIIIAGIVIASIGVAVWSTKEVRTLREQLNQAQAGTSDASEKEIQELVATLNKFIVLPQDETPTLATITDKTKLAELPFFAQGENGDKVLIYVNAHKAILFRPREQKIVEVATINLTSPEPSTTSVPETINGNIGIRNGTSTSGLTKQAESALLSKYPDATIQVKDNAKRTDFQDSIVVDVKGDRQADAQRLAAIFSAETQSLPAGEIVPAEVDLIVILGQDWATGATSPTATPPSE